MLRSLLLIGGTLLLVGSASADEATIYNLPSGSRPSARLLDDHGVLYGVSIFGGRHDAGFVFQVMQANGAWSGKNIFSFKGPDGFWPVSPLTLDNRTGVIYGTTSAGGAAARDGTIFSLSFADSEWTENVLYSFTDRQDGEEPTEKLLIDRATGTIYGTTPATYREKCGNIFQFVRSGDSWTFSPLYQFVNNINEGCTPWGVLESGSSPGTYFGTTSDINKGHRKHRIITGTVYKFTLSNGEPASQVISNFPYQSGEQPIDLAVVSDDLIYGVTVGPSNSGVAFELRNTKNGWTQTILYTFKGEPSGLRYDQSSDTIYGTTSGGGANGDGTLFKLTHLGKNWTETVLHSFGGAGDGMYPVGRPVQDPSTGVLYGTTESGGQFNGGTVYRYSP